MSTPEISLRRAEWDDVPVLFGMQCDPVACQMAGVKARTREVFEARWREVLADAAINAQVIELVRPASGGARVDGGRAVRDVVGSISVFQVPGEPGNNVGYWIAQAHWGKGIASRALRLFLGQEARRPLHATAAVANVASHRVLLGNGFRMVGTRMGEETDRYMAREIADFVLE